MSPISKKQKVTHNGDPCDVDGKDEDPSENLEHEQSVSDTSDESDRDESSSSVDTETEIALTHGKSKKTAKRKRRAVSPTPFGQALTTLLSTSTKTSQPLALLPEISKRKNEDKLEMRARRLLQVERKERDDRGRVKDVIGGWGGESERALRKVAQRGVVKLFNLIQQAQASATQAEEDLKKHRGTGKPSLPAPKADDFFKEGNSKSRKHTEVDLAKDDFLNMIRSGGVVSKD
ncbi:hypothetical protein FRB95_004506 [Tulasnella sp. JGI-2019a]|nr:hypothetical protein FRB95_004506 [Tulasnella sp. JGI-2019a]